MSAGTKRHDKRKPSLRHSRQHALCDACRPLGSHIASPNNTVLLIGRVRVESDSDQTTAFGPLPPAIHCATKLQAHFGVQ